MFRHLVDVYTLGGVDSHEDLIRPHTVVIMSYFVVYILTGVNGLCTVYLFP